MATCKEVADVLDDAYDIIDCEGWATGLDVNYGTAGPTCAAVAIVCAAGRRGISSVYPVHAFMAFVGTDSIPRWNDRQTSATRVLHALEVCADRLRFRGNDRYR